MVCIYFLDDNIRISDLYQMSFESFSNFLLTKDKIYLEHLINSISRIYLSFNSQIIFDIINNDISFRINQIICKRDNLIMRKNELENELNSLKEILSDINKMLDVQKDLIEKLETKLDIHI